MPDPLPDRADIDDLVRPIRRPRVCQGINNSRVAEQIELRELDDGCIPGVDGVRAGRQRDVPEIIIGGPPGPVRASVGRIDKLRIQVLTSRKSRVRLV